MQAVEEAEFREYAAARMLWLRRIGFLITGDWHLAEDTASTVLAKVYLRWGKLRRLDNLDAYVRTMLVRAIADERRRPWRRETPTHAPAELVSAGERETVRTPDDLVHDRVVLWDALRQVAPRRRAVLVLRYFEDLSVEETAAELGCSAGTVKSQTARGLDALREVLPPDFLEAGAASTTKKGGAR